MSVRKFLSMLFFGFLSKHVAGTRPLKDWERRWLLTAIFFYSWRATYYSLKVNNPEVLDSIKESFSSLRQSKRTNSLGLDFDNPSVTIRSDELYDALDDLHQSSGKSLREVIEDLQNRPPEFPFR